VNEVEVAVQAIKHGAYHYITKEFDYDGLRSLVRNALQRQDLSRRVVSLSAQVADQNDREFVPGPSQVMREVVTMVKKVANLPATVLILGESGTGKELLARLLHRESGRGDAPFIAVNLAAIPREVVERLKPLGLEGFKVTLDGDRESHDRMRPLRGGQGTFDKIIDNIRQVAPLCNIAIGGNFDEQSVDSYPALLDFLKEQSFADSLVKVAFKPIISTEPVAQSNGLIPLTALDSSGKALGGGCMTAAGAGGGSPCDTCNFIDEKMSFLREETKKRDFPTLTACTWAPARSTRSTPTPSAQTDRCSPALGSRPNSASRWATSTTTDRTKACGRRRRSDSKNSVPGIPAGDCSFIPVCAGGCSVAAHNELGNMNEKSCHKTSFESSMVSLAHSAAGVS